MYLADKIPFHNPFRKYHPGGFRALTINYLIFQFSLRMIGLFGALFIYQLGNGFAEGILYLLGYFGIQRIFVLLMIFPVGKALSIIGYRWMMLIGLVALSTKFFFLSEVANGSVWLLIPAMILGGFQIPAYYLSYHGIFLEDNDDDKIGEQIGYLTTIGRVAALASPFISGLIVSFYGFSTMFIVSTALFLISAIPLFAMKHHKRHVGTFTGVRIWNFIKNKKRVFGSVYSWYFTVGIQEIFWPIYLFSVLKNYKIFGFVGSIVMIVGSISLYLSGKIYDKKAYKDVFVGSSLGVSFSWVARFLSLTPIIATLSDAINRLFSPPWWMKIRRQELLAGEDEDSLVFGAVHEYIATLGYITSWVIAFTFLYISGGNWLFLIVPTVFATLTSSYLLRND